MSWLRDLWNTATYRDPGSRYAGCPDFAGRSMAAEFGPPVAVTHADLIKALGKRAELYSPAELRRVTAGRTKHAPVSQPPVSLVGLPVGAEYVPEPEPRWVPALVFEEA